MAAPRARNVCGSFKTLDGLLPNEVHPSYHHVGIRSLQGEQACGIEWAVKRPQPRGAQGLPGLEYLLTYAAMSSPWAYIADGTSPPRFYHRTPYTLDTNVRKADNQVMTSDTISAPAPPRTRRQLATQAPDWRRLDEAQVAAELLQILQSARRLKDAPPFGQVGTVQVPSIVAVWLLSQVGRAVGSARLVNLRQVRRQELRSIAGVAGLVHTALGQIPQSLSLVAVG